MTGHSTVPGIRRCPSARRATKNLRYIPRMQAWRDRPFSDRKHPCRHEEKTRGVVHVTARSQPAIHRYAMTKRSRPISGAASSTRAKPAVVEMLSSSPKVYASPAGVQASIITLKAAAVGGVTRSEFGTSSAIAARPPGFSTACTFRMKAVQVGGSKWWRKFVINTRS